MHISPELFSRKMSSRWATLGNIPSGALERLWHKTATIYNSQMAGSLSASTSNISVIQAETGTGKTQGLCLYCSMLPSTTGVLIVTRTIAQANEIASLINDLKKASIAAASHGDNELSHEKIKAYQILVITHRRYEIALVENTRGKPENLDNLIALSEGQRMLTVIDEAPEFVMTVKLTLDNLSKAIGNIPNHIRVQFPDTMKALDTMLEHLRKASQPEESGTVHNHIVRHTALSDGEDYTTRELCTALRGYEGFDSIQSKKNTIQTLKDVQSIANHWCIYLKEGKIDSFNTARNILPTGLKNIVILDATATFNPIYKLLRQIEVPDLPQARSYSQVTLHVARGSGTGKTAMYDKRQKRSDLLASYVQDYIGSDKQIFLCCHKDVESSLHGFELPHRAFEIDHWGNIDGRNDWQEFDTAIIFGIPFLPSSWSALTLAATKGLSTTDAALGSNKGGHSENPRRLKTMEEGKATTSIIQAINRVRCRRVIDKDGNCKPTDVYILLPEGQIGDRLLSNIKAGMPGIQQTEWTIELEAKTPRIRKSMHEETLVNYLSNSKSRELEARYVCDQIGASTSTWKRIVKNIKDDTSELYQKFKDSGVIFISSGKGRGSQSYFLIHH